MSDEWQPWFAWYPVLTGWTGRWCWLRIVYRRRISPIMLDHAWWHYREAPPVSAQ